MKEAAESLVFVNFGTRTKRQAINRFKSSSPPFSCFAMASIEFSMICRIISMASYSKASTLTAA